jgi:hypothetical protein
VLVGRAFAHQHFAVGEIAQVDELREHRELVVVEVGRELARAQGGQTDFLGHHAT